MQRGADTDLSIRGDMLNGRAVTHDVSFSLHAGEILAIAGESGSGKSSLLRAAMGLLGRDGLVTRGDIWFQGLDLPDLTERKLRQLRGAEIGMIFQDAGASFCPIRTVGAQIFESMAAHGKITRAEARAQALQLFDKLDLQDGRGSGTAIPLRCPAAWCSGWGSPPPC